MKKEYTTDPPDDCGPILSRLKLYIEKAYTKDYKQDLQTLLRNSTLSLIKTGSWGEKYGFAEVKATMTTSSSNLDLAGPGALRKLKECFNIILETTEYKLEVTEIRFVPDDDSEVGMDEQIEEIVNQNKDLVHHLELPDDLLHRARSMSEVYLYIYFVENSLRYLLEKVGNEVTLNLPRDVQNTITKNRAAESQNKYLPARGSSDVYYCDFIQLNQIIVANWDAFKEYFPHGDQHWIRTKVEDIYRVRNLVMHCGWISNEDFDLIRANYSAILKQLHIK